MYCSHCGEKVIDKQDYSIVEFLKNVLSAFTNIDTHFFRSFYLLLKKPGFLSAEYIAGRRVHYLKPIQLFLIANVIYFLIQPLTGINGFNTPLNSQLHRLPYSPLITQLAENRMDQAQLTPENFEKQYNAKSENYAKSLIIVIIPLFAFLLKLIYLGHGRYFFEHLVFSLHFFAFILLYLFSVIFLFYHMLAVIIPAISSEFYLTLSALFIISIYLFFALQFFYEGWKWLTFIKSIVLFFGFFILIFVFRFILFFVTIYSI